jgi:hypothetical protein
VYGAEMSIRAWEERRKVYGKELLIFATYIIRVI